MQNLASMSNLAIVTDNQRNEQFLRASRKLGNVKETISHMGPQVITDGVNLFGGQGYPSKLGNRVAVETNCGPGGSREVMKTGSQGVHGSVNPGNPTPAGEIFPGFGSRK